MQTRPPLPKWAEGVLRKVPEMLGRTIALMLALALAAEPAAACTLWAAAGTADGGGTLLSKNRDWKPDHRQETRLVRGQGFAFFGLYAVEGTDPGLKAGVNEKGLSIVSASASSVPKAVRKAETGTRPVMARLLRTETSVDDVIRDADALFGHSRANFFAIADRAKTLFVEVAPGGRYALHATGNGTDAHTNHYIDPALTGSNVKVGRSSATRLARVNALLAQTQGPLDLNRFIAISGDRHDGPNDSLWRSGTEHTLASWIVRSPVEGPQTLRVVLANPGEAPVETTYTLDRAFWQAP